MNPLRRSDKSFSSIMKYSCPNIWWVKLTILSVQQRKRSPFDPTCWMNILDSDQIRLVPRHVAAVDFHGPCMFRRREVFAVQIQRLHFKSNERVWTASDIFLSHMALLSTWLLQYIIFIHRINDSTGIN